MYIRAGEKGEVMTPKKPEDMIDITKIPQEPELVEVERTPAPEMPVPGITERTIKRSWTNKNPSRKPSGDDGMVPHKPYTYNLAEFGVGGADNGWVR